MEMRVTDIRTATARLTRPQSLTMMTRDDVKTLLTQGPSELRHLFPEERILIDWHPFRVIPDNLDLVTHGSDPVFVCDVDDLAALRNKGGNSIVLQDKGGNFLLSLISCSTNYHCQRGRNYDVVFFGTGSDAELLAHVHWHLFRLAELAEEDVAVMKLFHTRGLDDLVAKVKENFDVTPVTFAFVKCIVLEKNSV
jgi:hypothetical protein